MGYNISIDLTYAFRDSLPRNFLMILELLLPISWIMTKLIFIGVILEDTIPLHGKNNMQHLYIPTRNWYIYWNNIRRNHCIAWEKIIYIILYSTYQKLKNSLGWECFPLCTTEGNALTITLRFFISDCKVINIFSTPLCFHHTRIHIHEHTNTHTSHHTSLKVLFSFLSFCLSNQEFGSVTSWFNLNNLKYLNEW